MQWATGAIEYHHIHHLNAKVPLYRLRECHENAPAGMWEGVKIITLREGWDSLSLTLYDEQLGRLVSFKELDAAKSGKSL